MAQLVGMPGLVAPVEQVELRARLAPTLRRWSVAPAGAAVTPESLVVARRARQAWPVPLSAAVAALVAPAVLAERAVIAAPVAPAAVVVPGRAAAVVWAWRPSAALVAVAARAGPASMRAFSPMAPLVVTRALVALVAWAELRAHRAPTRHRWLVALAASAATPERLVLARRVLAA
jgi:hypothetical protein